jgi:hypothetical protein
MNVEQITPRMLDDAIRWQVRRPQDNSGRVQLVAIAMQSPEFVEYMMLAHAQMALRLMLKTAMRHTLLALTASKDSRRQA